MSYKILDRYNITIEGKNKYDLPQRTFLIFMEKIVNNITYNKLTLDLKNQGQSIIKPIHKHYEELRLLIEELELKDQFGDFDNDKVSKWKFKIDNRIESSRLFSYFNASNIIDENEESIKDKLLYDKTILLDLCDRDDIEIIGFKINKVKPGDYKSFCISKMRLINYDIDKNLITFQSLIDPRVIMPQFNISAVNMIERCIDYLKNVEILKKDTEMSLNDFILKHGKEWTELYDKSVKIEYIHINDNVTNCMTLFTKKYNLSLELFYNNNIRNDTNKRSIITNVITPNMSSNLRERLNLIIKELETLKDFEIKYSVEKINLNKQ